MKHESFNTLPKTTLMHLMDTFGIGLFTATIAYIYFNWSTLPTEVPIYFGLKGDIHRYGAKWELLLFPFITLLIGIALRFLEKHPKWHYFPLNITDPHIEKEVKQSVFMLSFIKNMSCLLLAIVVWETIHIAQGNSTALEGVAWLILSLIIFLPTIITVISALRA